MANNFFNIVILSGEVGWVKVEYTKDKKMFVRFGINQPKLTWDDSGNVTSRSTNLYFVNCFDVALLNGVTLKKGIFVEVRGKLDAYIDGNNKSSFAINAEHISIPILKEL